MSLLCVIYSVTLLSLDAIATTSAENAQIASYSHVPGSRRYYIGPDKVTCDEAAVMCRRKSMELVSIRNEKENNDIFLFLSQQDMKGGFYTSGMREENADSWAWLDGEPIKYFNWDNVAPYTTGTTKSCIVVVKGLKTVIWEQQTHGIRSSYICESPVENCNTLSNEKGSCTPAEIEKKKYYLGTEMVTYHRAIRYCEEMFLQLATVENAEDESTIQSLIQAIRGNTGKGFWISANQSPNSKTWEWFGGRPVKYFNWDVEKPKIPGYKEKCVIVYKKNGHMKWSESSCTTTRYALCEKIDPSVEIYVNQKLVSSNSLKSHPGQSDFLEVFLDLKSRDFLLGWKVVRK